MFQVWTVRTCEAVVRVKLKVVAFSSLFPIAIHHYSLSLSKLFSATFPSPTLSLSETQNQKRKGGRMDLPNWFQALPFILLKFLNWYFHFFNLAWPYILLLLLDPLFSHFFKIELGEFYPFRPKAANLLFLGSDDYKRSVILNLSDEDEGIFGIETPPYSRLSSMGRIKFNLFDFGELRTACRVWKDYCAKRDAIVYVVNAADTSMEQFSEAREDLHDLLSDEDFINVPLLIFCETPEPSYPSEKELCFLLGLTDKTTGKGRVKLQAGTNARPLEVFVAEPSNRKQHQDAIKWLSQYIK